MTENKLSRYLGYAIGEIILVAVGILLALQINNWNEQRKLNIKEIKTLTDLKYDLEKNIKSTRDGINYMNGFLNSCKKIIYAIEHKQPYEEGINSAFGQFYLVYYPNFSTGSYENLKNEGINLISNKRLKNAIVTVFDIKTERIEEDRTNRQFVYNSSVVMPMVTKYFFNDLSTPGYNLIPSNYKKMLQDKVFYNMCTILAANYLKDIRWYEMYISDSENLINQINSEIQGLERRD